MEKIYKKGGRPKMLASEKKSYKITVKLVTIEYYSLLAKVKKANTNVSEFVRQCICKGYIKEKISIEQMKIMRQLSGMANNLNQIAKKANKEGSLQVRDECRELYKKIVSCLNEVKV